MALCTRHSFRCCVLLIAFVQLTIYSFYVLRFLQPKHPPANQEYSSDVNDIAETLSYNNGEMNITDSKSEGECLRMFLDTYSNYCEKSLVPPVGVVQGLVRSDSSWARKDLCPCVPANLTGRVNLNFSSARLSPNLFMGMVPGGHWAPSSCIPRQRVAIIIPFRDRASHLDIFLQVFHPFLQNQLLNYSIFVIEQTQPAVFNKASLMNAGFKEILKLTDRVFDCFVFHDIDTLPENDHNFYGCYKLPRHVGAFVDKLNYGLLYYRMFGGATAFTRRQFEVSNGYSNEYYGWGGEDDDMEKRITAANMTFIRFPKCVAKYTVIKHARDTGNPRNPQAAKGWYYRPNIYQRDGLNTLTYSLVSYEDRLLYTRIVIALPLTPPPLLPLLSPTAAAAPSPTSPINTTSPSGASMLAVPTNESSHQVVPKLSSQRTQLNVSKSSETLTVPKSEAQNNSLTHIQNV